MSRLATALAVVVLAVTAGCARMPGIYVAQKQDAGGGPDKAFNAQEYVASVWDAKVVPIVTSKAVDATTVLRAIAADPAAAGKKYGVQAGVGSPSSVLVKGAGTVLTVDGSQGGAGRMTVDLDPPDGRPDLSIATGPVFLGTALRDAVGFISFGQFPNQIEYANVATALNSRVREKVVAPADPATAKGRKVTFAGACQILDPKNIVVTPVQLAVAQ